MRIRHKAHSFVYLDITVQAISTNSSVLLSNLFSAIILKLSAKIYPQVKKLFAVDKVILIQTLTEFTVTAKNEFYNDSAKITADSFNVTVGNYFHNYSSTISANIFTVEAGSNFINQSSGTIST